MLKSPTKILYQSGTLYPDDIQYTDKDGDAGANQNLSEARAKSSEQYLIKKGIDPGRISTKGMGETQAKQDKPTEAEKASDRKIDIKVSDK